MKLVTRFAIAAKCETELGAILREAFDELARSKPHSHQRRNATGTYREHSEGDRFEGSISPRLRGVAPQCGTLHIYKL